MPRGSATVGITVSGGARASKIAKALRSAGQGGGLQAALSRNLRGAADAVVNDLRRAAMNIPDRSPATRSDGDSLRRGLSRSVQMQATPKGVRFWVDGSKMPAGTRLLPFAVEKTGGWRHPVFGRDVWVNQPGSPWFKPTIQKHETDFRRAVESAMDEVARELQ